MEQDPPAPDPVEDKDEEAPRRESRRLRERERPVVVALPPHPHFASKHYPPSAHGERRFPRLADTPAPLPDGASTSFSYRGPPQPPVPVASAPPPPGGTPLVLDRPEIDSQAVLANMLSQRIDQVDQLRAQLAHAEARIASLSARSNPTAALAQAEARAEAAEARLAAIKEAWRGVESYLDMLARRESEARAAFVRTLGTGEIGVPPSVPVFVRPSVRTFPPLPPAPVPGANPVVWRHETGRRRPADDDPDHPHKRPRPDRRRDREVRKEKARFSDSPSPQPKEDLSPPIASLPDDKDADADADADEEVDQIVDDEPAKRDDKPDDHMDDPSPATDTDELSVDEELLKLSSKSARRRRPYEREYDREYAHTEYHDYRYPTDPRFAPWYGEYYPDDYREAQPRGYQPPRTDLRNGSSSAPWYAHLKQGTTVSTNTQGQRTCRQCGLAGRYKDGKCVEKWGPGPEGPGTVCDRCRKKMKRVERRGTADASALAAIQMHPSFTQSSATQPQTPSQSLSQTQLGTQYSPQRWANGNGRFENGDKRYDVYDKRRRESAEPTTAPTKDAAVEA